MGKRRKKTVKEICKLIDLIIAGKDPGVDYRVINNHLSEIRIEKITYQDVLLACETVLRIAKTKNRVLRYLEGDFWRFVNTIPNEIVTTYGLGDDRKTELLPNVDYETITKKILSRLLGLALEVLELKDDRSNASVLRRTKAIELVANLLWYFRIPGAKELLIASLKSKNDREQFVALMGLGSYYESADETIDKGLLRTLNSIKRRTKDSIVVSTCLQIQIDAGLIDERSALDELDDWKYEQNDW